jgi:hypothetical protein
MRHPRHSQTFIFAMALPAHSGPWSLIQFHNHSLQTVRLLDKWSAPFARPLPKDRTAQTQNKYIHIPNIHTLSGIRTHDPSVRERDGSSSLRTRSYCDWPFTDIAKINGHSVSSEPNETKWTIVGLSFFFMKNRCASYAELLGFDCPAKLPHRFLIIFSRFARKWREIKRVTEHATIRHLFIH